MRTRDPLGTGLVLGLYVVPVGVATVWLVTAGLAVLALALVVVEVCVAAAVVWATRTG
jgi:hypothetical protein